MNGHTEVVKFLLSNGADVNIHDIGYFSRTPLIAAGIYGHLELVKLLIKKKVQM